MIIDSAEKRLGLCLFFADKEVYDFGTTELKLVVLF